MQAYKRKILQIQRWLRANGHNVDFFEERAGGIVLKSKPSADQLRAFWESKKKNKPDIRRKTLEAFRSAINKYIEVQSETPDNTVGPYTDKELKWLKRWLDGFRNETSLNIREGIISGVEGKREMTPDEFIKLAYHTMTTQCLPVQQNDSAPPAQQHDAPASAQQHDSATQRRGKKKKQPRSRCPTELPLFTTLGWNLCARLDTSSSVHACHLDWSEDAMLVGIGKSKRNYRELLQQFRLYCNPYRPEVCPILSMAIHCACEPSVLMDGENGLPLFHDTKGTSDLCEDFGSACKELGIGGVSTHSIRKGAITHASNGTPDFAPIVAALCRARQKTQQLTVFLKYAKQSPATDALIGRLLALLDPQTPEFASLPPRFENERDWEPYVAELYGSGLTQGIRRLRPRLLAVLISQEPWLRCHLPESHPLWKTPFGTWSAAVLKQMREDITHVPTPGSAATGVPISVKILQELKVV
jgi:integrase